MPEAVDVFKAILKNASVLLVPNFAKGLKLAVVACDTDAGSVLLQQESNSVDHPVFFTFRNNLASIRETTQL